MPIRPAADSPLPKNDTEMFAEFRKQGRCPIETLDWYRLPQLFRLGQNLFGNAMLGYKSRARKNIDSSIIHACRVWKQKYPAGNCSAERQATCCALLEQAFKEAKVDGIPAHPMILTTLRRLVNSEWADAALKRTVPETTIELVSVFKSL